MSHVLQREENIYNLLDPSQIVCSNAAHHLTHKWLKSPQPRQTKSANNFPPYPKLYLEIGWAGLLAKLSLAKLNKTRSFAGNSTNEDYNASDFSEYCEKISTVMRMWEQIEKMKSSLIKTPK